MYGMYISLSRYDFVMKVVKNGNQEVKNILFRK